MNDCDKRPFQLTWLQASSCPCCYDVLSALWTNSEIIMQMWTIVSDVAIVTRMHVQPFSSAMCLLADVLVKCLFL